MAGTGEINLGPKGAGFALVVFFAAARRGGRVTTIADSSSACWSPTGGGEWITVPDGFRMRRTRGGLVWLFNGTSGCSLDSAGISGGVARRDALISPVLLLDIR